MKDQRQRHRYSRVAGVAISTLAVTALIALSTGQTRDLSASGSSRGELINGIASLLNARSPGNRTKAELTKSKQSNRAPVESVGEETERVLGKTFPPDTDDLPLDTPEELLSQNNPGNQIFEVPAGADDVWQLAETTLDGAIPTSGGSNGGNWIIGGGSGGSGSGGGGGGTGGQPPIPPGPVPSVPEPSTWAMMLLGAAMCGASMRRRNRIRRQTAA